MGDLKEKLNSMSLGDLIVEMHKIHSQDPNVIKPEAPEASREAKEMYDHIRDELNRRGRVYQRDQTLPAYMTDFP